MSEEEFPKGNLNSDPPYGLLNLRIYRAPCGFADERPSAHIRRR